MSQLMDTSLQFHYSFQTDYWHSWRWLSGLSCTLNPYVAYIYQRAHSQWECTPLDYSSTKSQTAFCHFRCMDTIGTSSFTSRSLVTLSASCTKLNFRVCWRGDVTAQHSSISTIWTSEFIGIEVIKVTSKKNFTLHEPMFDYINHMSITTVHHWQY